MSEKQLLHEINSSREATEEITKKVIRSIRASAQGMTTHQYELFLRDIGIRFK